MKPAKAARRNSSPLPAAKQNAQPISDPPAGSCLEAPPATSQDDPVFFFKANEQNGAFCQWYPATFTVTKQEMSDLVGHEIDPGDPWTPIYFNCAEQFMMYCKAGRFRDETAQQLILATRDPKEQKRIARGTKGFVAQSWDKIKSQVVLAGSIAKFGQNPTLRTLLLDTGDRLLVEAASEDRVWGIGFTAHEAMMPQNRGKWGENRLGEALMGARKHLRNASLYTS